VLALEYQPQRELEVKPTKFPISMQTTERFSSLPLQS